MRPPDSWQRARTTLVIAAVTAAAWLIPYLLGLEEQAAMLGGFIPARIGAQSGVAALAPLLAAPLTATLVHAGPIHIVFNLLILLFCGRAVETIIGRRGLLILYIVGAYAAAAAHYLTGPADPTPMVGASGAISAVLGAYAMLFGRNKVKIANPTLALWINALWLAIAWVGLQLMIGLTFEVEGNRIAFAAHIGGFLAGLVLAKPLLLLRYRNA
jgi:membrane associated rhomboid family serine protease